MKSRMTLIVAAIGLASGAAFAQDTRVETEVQRSTNQQERIGQGLQSGQLTNKEAGQLEREQSHIDKMEQRDLRDGKISAKEQTKLNAAQSKASADIYAQKHDEQTGDPKSASSQRMQADVQRNVSQQQRVEQGLKSGSLTNREAGRLEGGQARVERREANVAANGHVNAREEARVQRAQNRQSRHIRKQKHDAQTK